MVLSVDWDELAKPKKKLKDIVKERDIPKREKPKPRSKPRKKTSTKTRDVLVSVRDFIESHKHQAYFKRRWNPWKMYVDKINEVLK